MRELRARGRARQRAVTAWGTEALVAAHVAGRAHDATLAEAGVERGIGLEAGARPRHRRLLGEGRVARVALEGGAARLRLHLHELPRDARPHGHRVHARAPVPELHGVTRPARLGHQLGLERAPALRGRALRRDRRRPVPADEVADGFGREGRRGDAGQEHRAREQATHRSTLPWNGARSSAAGQLRTACYASPPVGSDAVVVTQIGWKAQRLVAGAAAVPAVVAELSRSVYLDVDGEIVWLGPTGSTLHGRAIITDTVVAGARFDLSAARPWSPPSLPRGTTVDAMARAATRLAQALPCIGRPDGFGPLLRGEAPAFPLSHVTGAATAFLAACGAGDASAAAERAEPLLGVGPGLTPAGDDLVGGAFFARWALADTGAVDGAPWRLAAAYLRERAPQRTHRISATLLDDLLEGDAYAPLHDLAVALMLGDAPTAVAAAARLTRIGHSSGWDMLTGFLGALGAPSTAP